MTIVHPSSEKIIRYVRGYLDAPGSPVVLRLEEHLLNCPHCVLRAELAVEFAQALRAAVTTPPYDDQEPVPGSPVPES
jgi:hypothetical protein